MKLKAVLSLTAFFLSISFHLFPQQGVSIIDSRHYSSIFGETRNYRVFLPPGYYKNPGKKYPVIYFLHGWSQRSFGSTVSRYSLFDRGDENNGDNMEKFVATHDVIVVKSDGYNRSAGEEYYLRPYNIGPVETFRQFPVYFPELVNHIDATYHTKSTRENRAITGLSMGGFMSFVIGGKYPHLFAAAGNFCGSPEFVIGPKEMPVEYRHLDMYNNYDGMKLRLNYGDQDFIRGYHEDLNRIWPEVMDNYQYKIYSTDHTTSGLGEMFEFLFASFNKPVSKPKRWHHVDIYPEFAVWDYTVKTDRVVPGFTKLENVDQRGFTCSVREFLPDGELLPLVNVTVITAPVYERNQLYVVNDIDGSTSIAVQQTIKSDNNGRLRIELGGGLHHIGINKRIDKADVAIASVSVMNNDWVIAGKEMSVGIKLVNKGQSDAVAIRARLSAVSKTVQIENAEAGFGTIAVNKVKAGETYFRFKTVNDTVEIIKFKLTIQDAGKNEWSEFFELPVRKDVPEATNFEIGDGKKFTIWKGGIDSETVVIGNGNGDGTANPGESIEVLIKDQDKYRRTLLYAADSCVNPFGVNKRGSDYWGIYDNVGGSAKYSVPLLSSACTANHTIHFYAEYWLPDKPFHIIKKTRVAIPITGKDETGPVASWAKVAGDNILQVKLSDGSAIKSVVATITSADKKSITTELSDKGEAGDRVAGDNVFSRTIEVPEFGEYTIAIEATDYYGNKSSSVMPGSFVFYSK